MKLGVEDGARAVGRGVRIRDRGVDNTPIRGGMNLSSPDPDP